MRSWVAGSLVFIALLYGAMASGVAEERRVALVIGNGAYSGTGTLANTINDAKAMAAVLEDLGFAVTLAKREAT